MSGDFQSMAASQNAYSVSINLICIQRYSRDVNVFITLTRKKHRSRVKCSHCNAVVFAHYLKKHMQKHLTVRPYKCNICGNSFTSQSQLNAHEFRHTNERPLECTMCDKKFKLACDLRIHMAVHNNVRKYRCDQCDKSFRMHSHLADHLETHRTEKTIPCPQCFQLFKTSVTLRSHIKQVHAKSYAFRCDQCDRGFFRRHKLLRHMGTHEKAAAAVLCAAIGSDSRS